MKNAATIAPKLRFLYGDGDGKVTVRYTPNTDDSAITIAEEDLQTLKGLTFKKICVKGAGAFEVTPVTGDRALTGKIAIVTGSAQGFGYGIADYLASRGASVVIADMNADGARGAAEAICKKNGVETLAVFCDVTKEESVEASSTQIISRSS